ncbi:MAG: endonuclease/exonuclease/phosphatase family protein [Friedmanniella sp.]
MKVSIPVARPEGLVGRLAAGVLLVLLVLASLPVPSASAATAVPTGLRSTAVTPTTVSLAWKAVAGAPMYRIKYSASASMTNAVFHRYTAPSGQVIGLQPGTSYYFQVRVITTAGASLSAYSPVVRVATAAKRTYNGLSATTPLRVGSYNIKCANCYAKQPNELPWSERRSAVVAAIRKQNLDVIGVQEASQGWLKDASGASINLSQFEDLQQRLGVPWKLTNDKRNNCVKSTTPTGCVYADQGASQGTRILYNSDRVELVSSGSKLLPSKDAANARYTAWAILRQRSTGVKFFFADSHLDPDAASYDLRKKEAEVAVQTIKEKNPGNLPVISVGDFNSSRFADPTNAPYDVYIKAGFVDPLGGAANSTRAVDPWADQRVSTWLNSYNGFVRHAKGNRSWDNGSYIDYMLTTPMRISEWETVAALDANDDFVGIIPSDHNLVRMTVYLPV